MPLSFLAFSPASFVVLYLILRFQDLLPLNPQGFAGFSPHLAFNTAVSFVTNTNWQSYVPETTVSTFSQMAGLTSHNFLSAAAGMAVAAALARAFAANRRETTSGDFWVDLTRISLYVLLPISFVIAVAYRRPRASRRPCWASVTRPYARGRQADHRPLSRPPARKRSSSSAPMAAASSTPTPPTRSRTPTRSPT